MENNQKQCSKCKEVKELSEFYKKKQSKQGVAASCKVCVCNRSKKYHHDNKEKQNKNSSEYAKKNREELKEKQKGYRESNKDEISKRRKKRYQENTEDIKAKNKVWRENNKEKIRQKRIKVYQTVELHISVNFCYRCEEVKVKEYFSKGRNLCKCCQSKIGREKYKQNHKEERRKKNEYRSKNTSKIRDWHNNYRKENKEYLNKTGRDRDKKRRKEEPLYNFKLKLRGSISQSFKRKGYTKKSKTFDILGVDYDYFLIYMSRKFQKGMSWDNHGDWHIDHIIPLATATTEEEVINLCHYTNLQPLWATDNMSKGNKIIDGTQTNLRL